MFVSKKKYEKLERVLKDSEEALKNALYYKTSYYSLVRRWNNMIDRINALGGEEFLNSNPQKSQFSKAEIETLIRLCHPDKHDGKQSAQDITKKLISLR